MTHPLIVSGLISFFANLAIGVFVYARNPKNRVNRMFALFSVTISGWSVGSFLENVIPQRELALTVLRSNYLFAVWLPAIYLHFCYSFSTITPQKKKILGLAYLFSTLLSTVAYTPLLIKDLRVLQTQPYLYLISAPGPAYYIFSIFFCVSVSLVMQVFLREMRNSKGQRRVQFKYLTVANAIAIAAGLEYFSRVFGVFQSPPLDDYILVVYLFVLAFAIVKHKLMDINVVIRRSLAYSILVTLLTVGYFGLVYGIERLFQATFGYQSVWISLSAFALMAFAFQPLKIAIQRVVDWLLFRAPHEELVRRMERLEREVRRSEKLKAVSTLAAGMAHEIKNPLTSIKTFASYLPEKGQDPEFQKKFQRIVTQEVDKIDRIVRQLLNFAKPAPPQLQPVKVSKLLDETLDFLNSETIRRHVEVMRAYEASRDAPARRSPERGEAEPRDDDGDDTIQADPQQLRQVFLNLFLNSLEAMTPPPADSPEANNRSSGPTAGGGVNGHGGKLSVATAKADGRLTITISDNGPGIPKDQLNRIFDPFFTTKSQGTGLGLSIVHGIIKEHRGDIRIASDPGHGTTVNIEFPLIR